MFKNITLPFILAIVLFSSTALAAEYVSVSKDGINVRAQSGTSSEILWEAFKGYPLMVLQRHDKWLQIQDFEGDKGWIYAPLVSKQNTLITKVKLANLRGGPGTNYEILSTVKYGVVFKPESKDDKWFKVSYEDGTVGWLHEDLVWPN